MSSTDPNASLTDNFLGGLEAAVETAADCTGLGATAGGDTGAGDITPPLDRKDFNGEGNPGGKGKPFLLVIQKEKILFYN